MSEKNKKQNIAPTVQATDTTSRRKIVGVITTVVLAAVAIISVAGINRCGPPPSFIGRTIDKITGKEIKGAKVSLEDGSVPSVAYTDSAGIFSFPVNDPNKEIHLRIEANQYENFDLRITPAKNSGIQDIRLTRREGDKPLMDQLDAQLGERNWFIYPDGNPNQIGVKRLPRGFRVESPVSQAQTCKGKSYGRGETVNDNCGANLTLERVIGGIPSWQTEAYERWTELRRNDPGRTALTTQRINEMFGRGNWRLNPGYQYYIIVPTLRTPLRIEYPITSVDAADNQKYGIGMDSVPSNQGATIWFAGEIR